MAERKSNIRRVGILFAGGPAPGANAVISSAALAFVKAGIEVIGFLHGYSRLQNFDEEKMPLVEGDAYIVLDFSRIVGTRNKRGIMIGSARANPGKMINCPEDLDDPEKSAPLRRTYLGLRSLGVDALISIGGDDTLKTANKLYEYQKHANIEDKVRVVHLPKTIDNDYNGIDFTFGYFTAVNFMAQEIRNLEADARANSAYFIAECMGRKAGWLAYGVAMAGEAQLVIGVEDIPDLMKNAGKEYQGFLDIHVLVDHIIDLIRARRARRQKFGVVVLAEGLAEKLPKDFLESTTLDEHGHISLGDVHLGHLVAKMIMKRLEELNLPKVKVNGVQLGYEARCASPHAFDVMLGSCLGVGAYVALVEKELDGHMVSTVGQLDHCFVPFSQLVDQKTLVTEVRYINTDSDFHKLAVLLGDDLGTKI
ncbi:MAG: 6-phosphofructokinase [Proteobacteria bacterium]|nr:6-phosphofructokinase [Pseudomonadota bacterium]